MMDPRKRTENTACGTCAWYESHELRTIITQRGSAPAQQQTDVVGQCCRSSPLQQTRPMTMRLAFPVVRDSDWCSEYLRAPSAGEAVDDGIAVPTAANLQRLDPTTRKKTQICEVCAWFDATSLEMRRLQPPTTAADPSYPGTCRRHPPITMLSAHLSSKQPEAFPSVQSDRWCGDFVQDPSFDSEPVA